MNFIKNVNSITVLLLFFILTLFLVGCGGNTANENKEHPININGENLENTDEEQNNQVEETPFEDDSAESDEDAMSDGNSIGDITDETFRNQIRSLGIDRLDEGQEYVLEWDLESVEINEMICYEIVGEGRGISLEGPNSTLEFEFYLNADGSINTNSSSLFFNIDGEMYGTFGTDVWEFIYAEDDGSVVYGEADLSEDPVADASTKLAVFYLNCGEI